MCVCVVEDERVDAEQRGGNLLHPGQWPRRGTGRSVLRVRLAVAQDRQVAEGTLCVVTSCGAPGQVFTPHPPAPLTSPVIHLVGGLQCYSLSPTTIDW